MKKIIKKIEIEIECDEDFDFGQMVSQVSENYGWKDIKVIFCEEFVRNENE